MNVMSTHTKKSTIRQNESGVVFVYILLAIALFAALSYAVSDNKGGSTNIFTDEQARLAAQEIIDYGNNVANAVQKLRLRGCSETEISFQNNVVSGYNNGTNTTCQVFHEDGGNINFPTFNETSYDLNAPVIDRISFNGDNQIIDNGSGDSELIFFNSAIKQNICENINNILHDNQAAFTGGDITVGSTKFTGSYSGSPDTMCGGSADSTTTGCCHETVGCGGGGECYHFYQVLLAR